MGRKLASLLVASMALKKVAQMARKKVEQKVEPLEGQMVAEKVDLTADHLAHDSVQNLVAKMVGLSEIN